MHMACEICGLARKNHANTEAIELIAGWKAGRLVYA